MTTKTTKKATAAGNYRLHREVIDSYLRDIKAGLDAHAKEFEASGSKDWGYAGDLNQFAADLKDVADALLKRGEYAPENVERVR
jgi:hypothetical protein